MGDADVVLYGHCNAVTTIATWKVHCESFNMCLNNSGIEKFLSIPQLEEYGYCVNYNKLGDWVVITPKGTHA